MESLNRLARRVPTWVVYLAGILPFGWIVWLTLTNGLGADPVKAIELRLGELGLQFLVGGLVITPLRWFGLNLIKFRDVADYPEGHPNHGKGLTGREAYAIYLEGFQYFNMGYAAALTLIFLVFILVFSVVQAFLADRRVRQAMALGGSSLKDFKDAHGSQGHFQLATAVYGREGEPCRVCRTPVKRVVQGQRSTFFCPNCQKR